ncbi:hypothetical protein J45TS6_41010 [Paenibacillus sp. J45TS6]|uniref:hypothetical protein n=1 Tax=Paenibacillus sp. J45TS6 TaxID=2807196 RepID=UPI001B2D8BA3|nr:hypothetical protein [Paenibacillus sp. J45TS6]GIP45642.1 hypothetical protein J45TS6_41010 [Paenibacillus sp. J45TS6]
MDSGAFHRDFGIRCRKFVYVGTISEQQRRKKETEKRDEKALLKGFFYLFHLISF